MIAGVIAEAGLSMVVFFVSVAIAVINPDRSNKVKPDNRVLVVFIY
mgnify:CR=1 FL=1